MLPPDITQRLFPEDGAIKYFIEFLLDYKQGDLEIGKNSSETIKKVTQSGRTNSVIVIIDLDKIKPESFSSFKKEYVKHERYLILEHSTYKNKRFLICLKPPYYRSSATTHCAGASDIARGPRSLLFPPELPHATSCIPRGPSAIQPASKHGVSG